MNIPEEIKRASKTRKLKDDGADGVTEAVSSIINLLGLRDDKVPQGRDKVDLLAYVYNSLGDFTKDEFRLAGTLFIKGKLDYQKELYDKFSPLFIENIMQSYARYRLSVAEKDTYHDKPQYVKPDDQEIAKIYRQTAIIQFETYRKKGMFVDFNSPLYRYFREKGLLRIPYSQVKEIIKESKIEVSNEQKIKETKVHTIADIRALFQNENKKKNVREKVKYNIVKLLFDSIAGINAEIENYI